jgi:methylase of polypeptide subunit release factors
MNYVIDLHGERELKLYYNSKVYDPHYSSTDVMALAIYYLRPGARVLDVACGTGITGLGIKKMYPSAAVSLCDIDPEAVRITKLNAKRNGLKVKVFQNDLLEGCGQYDFICANLPTFDASQMLSERLHGPEAAYSGGKDGLDLYRRLLEQAHGHAKIVLCELQAKRAEAVIEVAKELDWKLVVNIDDAYAFLRSK